MLPTLTIHLLKWMTFATGKNRIAQICFSCTFERFSNLAKHRTMGQFLIVSPQGLHKEQISVKFLHLRPKLNQHARTNTHTLSTRSVNNWKTPISRLHDSISIAQKATDLPRRGSPDLRGSFPHRRISMLILTPRFRSIECVRERVERDKKNGT